MIADVQNVEIQLFCSSPARRMNGLLVESLKSHSGVISVAQESPRKPWLSSLIDLMPLIQSRKQMLQKCVQRENFDVIHYFEMQHSGYLLRNVEIPTASRLAYSNYGSDIYWFYKFPNHARKIRALLSSTDLVFYECSRDLPTLSYNIKSSARLIKTINSGGLAPKKSLVDQTKNAILVKGYSNRWGQSIWAIRTILQLSPLIRDRFRVIMYSCDYHVPSIARLFSMLHGIKLETHLKGSLSHKETLSLFEQAMTHVAISKSDGVPSSTLEAMQAGAVPIQSKSACMEDWITDGVNGFLIDKDRSQLQRSLQKVLTDDQFRTRASRFNSEKLNKSHSVEKVSSAMLEGYEFLFDEKSLSDGV